MSTDEPVRVLFLCTENAARSQMAEGLLRSRGGGAYEVFSAGLSPNGVHPAAIEVMAEMGVDISGQTADDVAAYRDTELDYIVTLCGGAQDVSPSLRAQEMVIHHPVDDPAAVPASEQPEAFRRVRDALADWIDRTFALQAA
jgi:arsenate reductase